MNRIVIGVLSFVLLGSLLACQPKGPAERAGENIDKAGQNVRDAVDPPQGPAEKAGRSIDRTLSR